ncbi:hypothetical protein ZPR_4092 [Zunongwangia profunda SM-A87]|uniref:Uncharacterized protein n=1 Tax=Zunongwangia profunda (strain DSM 18752 / CCTCC AB 206139 / SM-A87) TaxID=655815 RepID=D5B9T3_ZUNPS|nr:hypothetical protein ZPR_4092 [Zunongwangia profunda SM-A87]
MGWESLKGFGNIVSIAISAIGSRQILVLYPEGGN